MIFQQKGYHWQNVIKYAKFDANEWKEVEMMQEELPRHNISNRVQRKHRWKLPDAGWMKCNVDGSFINEEAPNTGGSVLRDEHGCYRGAVQVEGKRVGTALESELQAILMSLQCCWSKGYRRVIIEGDSQKAIQLLNYQCKHFGLYNWIRDIKWWERRFEGVRYQWIGKEANKVADKLATHQDLNGDTYRFHYYVPCFITNLLHEDYVNSSFH